MRAGLLDRRITIQQYSEARNSYGDVIDTWSTLMTVWANYVQKKGSYTDADKNINHDISIWFYTRYFSDITENMRIVYNANYYKIEEIKEIGRQEGLQIVVSKLHQT